ncbi:MAG: hypothetical protein LBV00_06280 [Propionibacteriaceae bacterium]|jgi:hypothetical protein|nr:hypothetical protein [Propionibacteriaceae bacterium]
MTHDAEAAWPLTGTDQGYYPGPNPTTPPTQMPLAPMTTPNQYMPIMPATSHSKGMSPGLRLGYISAILGLSIPLTAIATSMIGFVGLVVVWAGIIMVTAIAFGLTGRTK